MSVTKVGAALLESGSKGADIASTGTMVIGKDGSYFDITGTTGIGTMTVDAGRIFTLQFDGAVVLTHSSTLYLAGAANFTTEANDHLTFVAVAANDVRQIGAGLKDGGSPIAGGGGLNFISKISVSSAVATVDFLTSFSSTYDNYMVVWNTSQPVTDAESFCLRIAQGGTAITASNYVRAVKGHNESNSDADTGSTGAAFLFLSATGVGNASVEEHTNGTLWIYNPLKAAATGMIWQAYVRNASDLMYIYNGSGNYSANNTADTGFQFLYQNGNISNGDFTLYGLAKS